MQNVSVNNLKDVDVSKLDKVSAAFVLYLFGFICFTVFGSFIQMKYVAHDEEMDGDDMMNKEFM